MIVGLTGGIGSGKTTVLKIFSAIGNIAIYNADVEAKKLMQTSQIIQRKIIEFFGEKSYVNGLLNRSYISSIVFNDTTKLVALNAIVHPEVFKHFKAFVADNSAKDYVLYENAILFENNSNSLCDIVVFVSVEKEERIKRVMQRDMVSRELVLERIQNQWSDTKKEIQSNYIVFNSDKKALKPQIVRIHNILTKKTC